MPIYNGIYTYTLTNGGGTLNLSVSEPTITRYILSGTPTLSSSWTIQPSGSPIEGMEFDIRYQAVTDLNGNNITIFGRALTQYEAEKDLIISCYYNGSAWDVDINIDEILWEPGTGTDSTTLISGGNTVSGTGAFSGGIGCTSTGDYSFSIQDSNDSTGNSAFSSGSSNTASGDNSVAMVGASTASGTDSVAIGRALTSSGDYANSINRLNTASGESAFSNGYSTTASGKYTQSGGYRSIASRYGAFSRASGKHNGNQTTEFAQYTKLTAWNTTSDGSAAVLYLDGTLATERVTIAANSAVMFKGEIIAVQDSGTSGTAGDTASWVFNGTIKNVAGTTALVDSVLYLAGAGTWGATTQRAQDAAAAAWAVAITADNANDALSISVTGEADKTIYWLCNLELTEIKFAT